MRVVNAFDAFHLLPGNSPFLFTNTNRCFYFGTDRVKNQKKNQTHRPKVMAGTAILPDARMRSADDSGDNYWPHNLLLSTAGSGGKQVFV